jgi:transcriptional regulator with XRE-family HTH domain
VTSLQPTSPAREEEHEIAVGPRLRQLRHARRLTLRAVADAAAVSESFLSQVERGRASASISSLKRIADALGVEIHELFAPRPNGTSRAIRSGDGEVLSFGRGARKRLLTPRPLEALEVVVCEFDAGGHSGDEPYTHGDAEELCVVLEGEVEHQVGDDVWRLAPGDAVHYRSSVPHRTANPGTTRARVLYVVTPPTF